MEQRPIRTNVFLDGPDESHQLLYRYPVTLLFVDLSPNEMAEPPGNKLLQKPAAK
jgi:hypothetical protein